MPYNTETGQYERRSTTILDSTPDGDSVNAALDVKADTAIDDATTDLNHHNINGGHYPALSVAAASRYLKQSAAGAVSWVNGVPIEDAAQSDLSNVTTAAVEAKVTAATILTKIKTVDGTGTGLDADLLDGQHASAFALDGHEHVVADITDFPTLGTASAEDIGTGDTNVPTVATVKSLSSDPHAPQSIVQSPVGTRPSGWTAANSDAPVQALTYSGDIVSLVAGVQFSYADNGRTTLSNQLNQNIELDVSLDEDGTHYIYAVMSDKQIVSLYKTTAVPVVGEENIQYYKPVTGGTIIGAGNNTSAAFDGNTNQNSSTCYSRSGTGYVGKNYGAPVKVHRATLYPATDTGFASYATVTINIFAGDVDNISMMNNVGSITFTDANPGPVREIITTSGDTAYQYQAVQIVVPSTSYAIYLAEAVFEQLLAKGPWYSPARNTMFDANDQPVTMVPVGFVVKSGGAITEAHSFARGSFVRLPAAATTLDNPFGGWNATAIQGSSLLTVTPTVISGVTVGYNPVTVRR